jgi:alpha-mannosidase
MIGNAHIDPVWLWRWQEGCHEVLASFRSALDRMHEDPDFIFVSSSAAFYAWVEQINPAMFEEIRQRVHEGRWEIVGGWWIQPDCNIPSGESFVRQSLYGQHYFKEKFGVTALVGYNVDSFGHNGTLPQILKLSGMDRYVFMRPGPQEKGLPSRLFWWESDDGSRVLTYRLPFEYCTWGRELDIHIRRVAGELRPPFDQLMCFYGVGNHGGGPTIENLKSIHRLDQSADMPKLMFSSPNRFFAAVAQQSDALPVVHGDLQHHASGCYAAHSGIKRWNRRAEWALTTAEKWAAIASMTTGLPYPTAEFARAWQGVLFNQFHDILAGTSLESAYDDARNLFGEAMTIADRAFNAATQSLAWNINIPMAEGRMPIVVFNPHAWAHKAVVELEFGRWTDEHGLADETGQPVPVQLIQSEATARGRHRLCFVAELPPLGYRVFHVVAQAAPAMHEPANESSDTTLENGRFRITFDAQTGYISNLYDKLAETGAFVGDAAIPVVVNDQSDTWSHNVFSFRDEIGRFTATSVRLIEHGPVRSVVRVMSEYGQSRLVQDFTLYAELDYVEVSALVDWHEQWKALKLRFPIDVHFHRTTAEIPYGATERFANGEEDPCQSWVDVSGSSRTTNELYGVSIINDSKYSYDIFVRDIGMTVLRSPIYAHHDPAVPEPDRMYSFIDQGVQRFRYAIYPHAAGWEEAQTVQRAAELNQRPYALIGTYHPAGTLPQIDTFVAVDQPNVVAAALKQAEDGDDLILRCYESTKTATDATIRLPHWERTIEARFRPGEIKTFRIPRDAAAPIVEVNLLEWGS